MELTATIRTLSSKGQLQTLRQEGKIPGILFSAREATPIALEAVDLKEKLGIVTLRLEEKLYQVLIKEVQRNPITYAPIHIDLQITHPDKPVRSAIPIRYVGEENAPGIKLGGSLRQLKRTLPVRALPGDLPLEISVDISHLDLQSSVRIGELSLPTGVTSPADPRHIVAKIAK